MSTKQSILIGVVSSLLTLAAVSALLLGSGTVIAQTPAPPTAGALLPDLDSRVPDLGGAPAFSEPESPEATTTYLNITGAAFVPIYSDAGVVYGGQGCTYSDGPSGHASRYFPITLPPGSVIHSVRFYYRDTSVSFDGELALYGLGYPFNGYVPANYVFSSGSSGVGYTDFTAYDLGVDYANYSYILRYDPGVSGSTMQLCGARITYTPPGIFAAALPYVGRQ